ncbi:SDR family oxidoreductase [uncultured Aliivibrio sp.]|uniref:UDP-glucose 4-epimerase family protein n=1 Tax=uncultured Aliivibrio sp. TaxID=873085 RepID=UPI00260E0A94|nr:SDR family oxidoreductase [uncultured Aliivibrio sp.]
MNFFLTGYTGFVGSNICNKLKDYNVVLAGRATSKNSSFKNAVYCTFDLKKTNILKPYLDGIDVAIHCAALVHITNDGNQEDYKKENVISTLEFAKQAASSGVKRFIFISTIKVNGESTELGRPFKPDDNYVPTDPYGLSKYEAEVGLRKIADETGMEVVIIRPPLVYGPGVKANFASMMKWVNKGVPLPLGGIKNNKRSLVSVDNLVDLIITCIEHPKAANQTFLVSDNADVSTTGLLNNMAVALNVPNRLIPIPASWFNLASKFAGKPAISQRLCGSLQVDISKTVDLLNWNPPYSSAECMKKTADAFLDTINKKNQ